MMPPKVCYAKKQDTSVFRNIALRARTKLVYNVEIITELLGKRRMQLKFNSRLNFLNKSWRWCPPESRRTGLESVNIGIPRCLDLLIVNIETIISKSIILLFNYSVMRWWNEEHFCLGKEQIKRTEELINWWELIKIFRSCFYYVVSVVYLTHRIFLTPRHFKDIKPTFCRSLSSILLQYMPFKLRRN